MLKPSYTKQFELDLKKVLKRGFSTVHFFTLL